MRILSDTRALVVFAVVAAGIVLPQGCADDEGKAPANPDGGSVGAERIDVACPTEGSGIPIPIGGRCGGSLMCRLPYGAECSSMGSPPPLYAECRNGIWRQVAIGQCGPAPYFPTSDAGTLDDGGVDEDGGPAR